MKRWIFWLAACLGVAGIIGCYPRPEPHDPYREESTSEQNFLRNVYFWLTDTTAAGDGRAVANFRESYRHYEAGRPQVVPEAQRIRKLEVWLLKTWPNANGCRIYTGRAAPLSQITGLTSGDFPVDQDHYSGQWILLNDSCLGNDRDWSLDSARGVIRLRWPDMVHDYDALAVAFSTVGGDTFGTLGARENGLRLILLHAAEFTPQSATWNLMFRHVYELEMGAEPERLDFRLNHLDDSPTESATLPDSALTYLEWLRHSLVQGDSLGVEYAGFGYAEVHSRDLTPFDPSGYWEDGVFVQTDLAALEAQTGHPYRAPFLYAEPTPDYHVQWGAAPRWRLRWVSWHVGI